MFNVQCSMFNGEVVSCEFGDSNQLWFEEVGLQLTVCHHRADAVFGEARRLDAHLAQDVEDGGEDVAVALQLYDYQVACSGICVGLVVVERDVEVYGQALGLSVVHECDTLETVLHGLYDVVERSACELAYEFVAARFDQQLPVVVGNGDALLLSAPVVVLRLHLKESEVAVEIGPHADLLAGCPPVVVLQEETVPRGVPIDRAVVRYAVSVDLLGEIFALGQLEHGSQFGLAGDELRVSSVHQLYSAHLIQ